MTFKVTPVKQLYYNDSGSEIGVFLLLYVKHVNFNLVWKFAEIHI